MPSVEARGLLNYRSVSNGGAEGVIPRYYIDELLDTLGQGTPGNVRFLLVPDQDLANGALCPDLGVHGLNATVQGANHDTPPLIRGGMLSSIFNGTDEEWTIADNALLSPITGGVDVAFSVGCAYKLAAGNAANKNLIAKWDDQTPNWEWRLGMSDAEFPFFMVVDDSVANSQRGRNYTTASTALRWYILIGTYNGVGGTDAHLGMNLYLWDMVNGWQGAVDNANSNGVGIYVDMEDTAEHVTIGAASVAAGPTEAEWWPGEIALPFMTLGDLSNTTGGVTYAERAATLMRRMLGFP